MTFLENLVHHPRRLWLRRALFQVHLWAGVLLSLYLVLISLSGALLVYHRQLIQWSMPSGLHSYSAAQVATPETVLQTARLRLPREKVSDLETPTPTLPAFRLTITAGDGKESTAVADPQTGAVYPLPHSWIDTVYDFHLYLLLGSAHGMQWNGVGAAGLLILTMSGIAVWWRGAARWWRGLGVAWRSNWRRINYDLHHALGFWTLLVVAWWSISGIYFAWYQPFEVVVNVISPLRGMREPAIRKSGPGRSIRSLDAILEIARNTSPLGRLGSITNATLDLGEDVYVYMNLAGSDDFAHSDILRFDPGTGELRSVWHYGQNRTLGDWFLWAMQPFHFGSLWGPWTRALWCALGISLAVLTISGLLMYWNRYLRPRWNRLRS